MAGACGEVREGGCDGQSNSEALDSCNGVVGFPEFPISEGLICGGQPMQYKEREEWGLGTEYEYGDVGQ